MDKTLNFLIREIRKQRGISLENLAADIDKNISELSLIERGIKTVNQEIFQNIMSLFNIEFNYDLTINEFLMEKLNALISLIYFCQKEKRVELIQSLRTSEDIYLHSNGRYIYILIRTISSVCSLPLYTRSEDIESDLQLLKSDFFCKNFNSDLVSMIYWASAEYYRKQYFYQKAIADNSISGKYQAEDRDNRIYCLIQHQALKLYESTFSHFESFRLINELKNVYASDHNFRRLISLANLEACLHMNLNDYASAQEILFRILDQSSNDLNGYLSITIIDNLIWCKIQMQEFQSAIELIDSLVSKVGINLRYNIILLPYCLYCAGLQKEASETADQFLSEAFDIESRQYLRMFKALIAGHSKTFFRESKALVNRMLKNNECDTAPFILKIRASFAHNHGEIELENKILHQIIDLSTRHNCYQSDF